MLAAHAPLRPRGPEECRVTADVIVEGTAGATAHDPAGRTGVTAKVWIPGWMGACGSAPLYPNGIQRWSGVDVAGPARAARG